MASLLNNASLLLNPAGSIISYQEDKIYSVIPNNGAGDFTFSGGDGGTRVNQQGYIEVTPHNLLDNSNTFSASGTWGTYTYNGGALSRTGGYPDPFGGNNAWLFEVTLGTGGILLTQNETIEEGVNYTLSVWMKGVVGGEKVQIDLRNTASSGYAGQLFTLTTEWVKYYVTVNNVSGTARGFQFRVTTIQSPGDQDFYVYGAQLNAGDLKPYQPTTDRLNYPRITYQNGKGALLTEPQRTNLWRYSQTFTTYSLFRLTLTQNAGISPDGTSNAVRWVDTATTGNHQLEPNFTAVSGQTYTVSVFVKAAERTQFHIFAFADNGVFNSTDAFYDVAAGTVISGTGASIEKWPNGWYRCIRTMTAGASGTGYWGVGPAVNGAASYAGDTNSGILVWGGQNEAGSFPTSYIPTTSATVTRPTDKAFRYSATSLIGQSEGTVYFDFTLDNLCDGLQTNQPVLWYMKDGGTGERYVELISGNKLVYIEYNGAVIANIQTSAITAGRHKCAIAYANNDMVFYVNGVQIGTDTSGTPSGFSTVSTQYYNSVFDGQCKAHSLAPYTSRLSNTQLAELTTVRSGSGGTISYYGPYTIHTFTGSATFTPSFNGEVEVLVVAGGGGAGGGGGGGGAGGLLYVSSAGVSQGTGYTITVGAGGVGYNSNTAGTNGSNSSAFGLNAIGGAGGSAMVNGQASLIGGSGGGGTINTIAGSGTVGQGNNGGNGGQHSSQVWNVGGGGGGAGAAGQNFNGRGTDLPGNGGVGLPYSISGFSTYYAGGGGGGTQAGTQNGGTGGLGGGGNGGQGASISSGLAQDGVSGLGGGGGASNEGGGLFGKAGNGGSGIVIVRYLT